MRPYLFRYRKSSIYSALFFSLILFSCEKPEGPGGNAEIKGRVIMEVYDPGFRVLQSSRPAQDEDVFIIYGDNDTYADDVSTSYDGVFSFPYLTKGDYTVFMYSEDETMTSEDGKKTIQRHLTLNDNKDTHDLGEIITYETMDIDDGFASISGQIMQVNYSNNFIFIKDTTYAQELVVYLIYENDNTYCERIRTLEDGSYAFKNLIKGNYTVLYYSENLNGSAEDIAVTIPATISDMHQTISLGETYRNNED